VVQQLVEWARCIKSSTQLDDSFFIRIGTGLGRLDREVRCVTLPALPFAVFFWVQSFPAVPTTPRLSLVVVSGSWAAEDPVGPVERAAEPAEVAGLALVVAVALGAQVADPEVQAGRAGQEATSFEFPAIQVQHLIPYLPQFPSRDS
jgi:hypothetical protein